jgi:hypothetical protein
LHRCTPLPVRGLHLGGTALSLLVLPLFIIIGVPVGIVTAALTDWWLGEGIHRGLVQCAVGLWHDACTRWVSVGNGVHGWLVALESLLLPITAQAAHEDGCPPQAALSARCAALVERVERQQRAAGVLAPGEAPQLFAFAPSDRVCSIPSFEASSFAATFPRQAVRRLQISGGGLRDHNFDVSALQLARQAFHVLCSVAALRAQLHRLDASRRDACFSALPVQARTAMEHESGASARAPLLF